MKIIFGLIFIFCSLSAQAYQKGVVLGLYAKDPAYSYLQDLQEIQKTGADHISLVVSWYQKNVYSTDIYPRWAAKGNAYGDFETTSDEKLFQVIQQAHQLGLKILIFPILRIEERKDKEWRGSVKPLDKEKWLLSLKNFTLHYVRLAAQNNVELFSIGSEFCSMEQETDFWKSLIHEIRVVFPGELLYSANWDHYKKIKFWEDLDYLGLNGYYTLTKSDVPRVDELIQKWGAIEESLEDWQKQYGKKILFTEVGYPSIDGACRDPWDYTRHASLNIDEQALCYEAFFRSWNTSPKLGGVYFWNWYGQGGEKDRSYTPRGKPAEKVLTKWYSGDPPSKTLYLAY